MARKLHFFKDQMLKAGLTPPIKSTRTVDNDIDDLEVCYDLYLFLLEMKLYINQLYVSPFLVFDMLGKTWRS